jgi:N-formylglutamate deformylase
MSTFLQGESLLKLFNLLVPAPVTLPIVASLPHSGTYAPPRVLRQYRQQPPPVLAPVDWHLERLYSFLPELGVTVIQATHSRYVVNLNRGLTPPLFGPEMESVVSRSNCFAEPLYDSGPGEDAVRDRINRYYLPYHRRLEGLLRKAVQDFGRAYLVDLHSYRQGPTADVCLGDVNGTTCSGFLTDCIERAFRLQGFSVVRNDVWLGGYITRHYGAMPGMEALQIELHFPAYLEGDTFEKDEVPAYDSAKFRGVQERLRIVFGQVIKDLL